MYVADKNNSRIQVFDDNGTFIKILGTKGSADSQFLRPEDIEIDSSNNLYVTDTGNYRVQKFDSNGTFMTKWGSKGDGDGQFLHPHGIGVDNKSENVYIADPGIPKVGGVVQKLTVSRSR